MGEHEADYDHTVFERDDEQWGLEYWAALEPDGAGDTSENSSAMATRAEANEHPELTRAERKRRKQSRIAEAGKAIRDIVINMR